MEVAQREMASAAIRLHNEAAYREVRDNHCTKLWSERAPTPLVCLDAGVR